MPVVCCTFSSDRQTAANHRLVHFRTGFRHTGHLNIKSSRQLSNTRNFLSSIFEEILLAVIGMNYLDHLYLTLSLYSHITDIS